LSRGGVFQENEAKHKGYSDTNYLLCKCTPYLFIQLVTFCQLELIQAKKFGRGQNYCVERVKLSMLKLCRREITKAIQIVSKYK
jgi:hypothetical protein